MSATNIPILFLQGMMCDAQMFRSQIEVLEANHPIHIGDLTRDDSIPAMAERALAGAPDRFLLVGLSMGGIVGFEVWRQAAERVAGLALLDTNALAESEARKQERLSQMERARNGELRDILINELKPNYVAEVTRANQPLMAEILNMSISMGPAVFERQCKALMKRNSSVDTLKTITCPTLALCGDEDALCPVEYHELMAAAIPDCELVVLKGSGHLTSMEQPDAVTEALQSLIGRVEEAQNK